MPELPEVEVTRLGIAPHVEGKKVSDVITRRSGLRWPFPEGLKDKLIGHKILSTGRRGKYLLVEFKTGTVLIHLGMSGHLQIVPKNQEVQKHDHIDIILGKNALRLNDPRRFGAVLWHGHDEGEIEQHPLLQKLGVEPLSSAFSAHFLYEKTRTRQSSIKEVLLAGNIVVGVGNIYACESLFRAGISPIKLANEISLARYEKLVQAIRLILKAAIKKGGSTLRDFLNVNGQSGYFQQEYFVYARAGQACKICHNLIVQIKQGQRSTFYCRHCQK